MRNKKEISVSFGKWKIALIVLSIFAAVKMLFFAFGLDEEYQLVMAYRNVRGDKLFLDMWEPHQSSAFLCTLFMRPYLALFGETGLVIWLRLCGTFIHLGISIYFCLVLRRMMSKDAAFLLGIIYFNTIPKQIMLPEFGIMQVWFLTLLSLFMLQYYDNNVRNRKYLIVAAFALVLEVLSYPSCLLLYLLILWIIWRRSGKEKFADIGIFTGVCVLGGIVYLGMILQNNTPEELLRILSYIVNGDITHSLSLVDKLIALGKEIVIPFIICVAVFLLAKEGTEKFFKIGMIWAVALSCLVEVCYWAIFNMGYESMQVHLAVFAALGGWHDVREKKKAKMQERTEEKEIGEAIGEKIEEKIGEKIEEKIGEETENRRRLQKGLLLDGMALAGGALAAVLYLTDLGLMDSLPHAMTAAFFGMALVVMYWEEQGFGGIEKRIGESRSLKSGNSVTCIYVVLLLWALTAIFGKGYSLRSGTGYHNVLQSGGILKYGPAAGTISNYMCAYIYNCDYEDWQSMVQDGDRVLIMVDQVMNLGTIQYLFKDVEISHYSIVNPTAYDERLLAYWEMFPEKKPNVIIVDDWYGQLMTDPDGWLMRYAEGEFGYASVEQGRYIRIYRRNL